jgi:hypothetical protein
MIAGVMLAVGVAAVAAAACAGLGWAIRRSGRATATRLAVVVAQAVIAVAGATLALRAVGAPDWAATAVHVVAVGVLVTASLILAVAVMPRGRARHGQDQVTGAPHTGNQRSSSGSIGSSPASAA